MASDKLNQVGKAIRKIKTDVDYATKKYHTNTRIERTRDVFDSAIPFSMEFKTGDNDSVSLDLIFNKPPPLKGWGSGGVSGSCETFNFTDGADHLIRVSNIPYILNSVSVFRNGNKLPAYNYEETDPLNGLVFVQGSGGNDEITICYVYGDCTFDAGRGIHWYQGSMTIGVNAGPYDHHFGTATGDKY